MGFLGIFHNPGPEPKRRRGRPRGPEDPEVALRRVIKHEMKRNPDYALLAAREKFGLPKPPDPAEVETQKAFIELIQNDPEKRRQIAEHYFQARYQIPNNEHEESYRGSATEQLYEAFELVRSFRELLTEEAEGLHPRRDSDSVLSVISEIGREAMKPGGFLSGVIQTMGKQRPQIYTMTGPHQQPVLADAATMQLATESPAEQTDIAKPDQPEEPTPLPINDPIASCEFVWGKFMGFYEAAGTFERIGILAVLSHIHQCREDSEVIEAFAGYATEEMQPLLERARADAGWMHRFVERLRELFIGRFVGGQEPEHNGHDENQEEAIREEVTAEHGREGRRIA